MVACGSTQEAIRDCELLRKTFDNEGTPKAKGSQRFLDKFWTGPPISLVKRVSRFNMVCVYMYIYIYVCVCVCVHVHTYIYIHTHAHTHIYFIICIYIYILYIYIYYIYIYYIYIYGAKCTLLAGHALSTCFIVSYPETWWPGCRWTGCEADGRVLTEQGVFGKRRLLMIDTGVAFHVPTIGDFWTSPKQISVEISPIVGWCETWGHFTKPCELGCLISEGWAYPCWRLWLMIVDLKLIICWC